MSDSAIHRKHLTVFKLAMMAVVAIDSLKNLPANAQYGSHLLFYYLLAIIIFFIPSALVSAELATSFSQTGGAYIWVREAFGKRIAFLTIWMQWMVAIIWYPTILSFIAVNLAYLINPKLATNNLYVLLMTLCLFWLATFLISKGIKISSRITTFCAIVGVIIPMGFITCLGALWLYSGHYAQINVLTDVMPSSYSEHNLRLFISLMYSLMGMEMIAAHAGDVQNPQKGYPKALVLSAIIILATVIPASLAISIVIPSDKIDLTTGVIEAFTIFLNYFELASLKPLMIIVVAIGCFGIFYSWFLNTVRIFLVAAEDHCLPAFLQKTNTHQMPYRQLLIQGCIFSLISSAFILMPSVSSAFWLLTAACAELALIYYLFLFSAAICLRYKYPQLHRPFKVGHNITLWIICLAAMTACFISIVFGFIAPSEITDPYVLLYKFSLACLIIGSCVLGLVIYKTNQLRPET